MRLLSLRVAYFKGVRERSVTFRPVGITIIQGPNEVGKTSLVSALDILLSYPDSSQHRDVEATKTVGQDRGTEVEAVLQIEGQTYTYFKRYHRDRETRLTIEGSRARRAITGRDAHDFMAALMIHQVDEVLWRALKLEQGVAADTAAQVSLGNSLSLRQALDQAAGGQGVLGDESLFQRVRAARDQYFTNTGRESTRAFGNARSALAAREERVRTLEQAVSSVERDADLLRKLDRRVADLLSETDQAREHFDDVRRQVTALRVAENAHREALERLNAAQQQAAALESQSNVRDGLLTQEREFLAQLGHVDEDLQASADEEALAETALAGARAEHQSAQEAAEGARQTYEDLREDAEAVDLRNGLEVSSARLERVKRLTESASHNRERARQLLVDEDHLRAARRQQEKVTRAQAGLSVGSPQVHLQALGHVSLTTGGEPLVLEPGETKNITVTDLYRLQIPDALQITVRPGASVSDLRGKVTREQDTLNKLLAEIHAESLSEAEEAWEGKRALIHEAETAERQLAEELGGEPVASVEQRVQELGARYAAYRDRRPPDYELPTDADTVRRLGADAYEHMQTTLMAVQGAVVRVEQAEARHREAVKATRDLQTHRVTQETGLEGARRRLASERQRVSDEDLAGQLKTARAAIEDLAATVAAVRYQVEALGPEQLRSREDVLTGQMERLTNDLARYQRERAECHGRLVATGGEGLSEQLEEARTQRERAATVLHDIERQANAARLLLQVVEKHRNTEQQAYRAPLQRRIVELGQVVFGPSFHVDLDEELGITVRELDGVTLPIELLSTGAKEQMGLLVRLAAASLVSSGEGVPVVLDDTLGHTDDGRLDLMAAVLNAVGKQCQIVLLTSASGRYTRIADPLVVDMWGDDAAGAAQT